jgi:hypothetical protein
VPGGRAAHAGVSEGRVGRHGARVSAASSVRSTT